MYIHRARSHKYAPWSAICIQKALQRAYDRLWGGFVLPPHQMFEPLEPHSSMPQLHALHAAAGHLKSSPIYLNGTNSVGAMLTENIRGYNSCHTHEARHRYWVLPHNNCKCKWALTHHRLLSGPIICCVSHTNTNGPIRKCEWGLCVLGAEQIYCTCCHGICCTLF